MKRILGYGFLALLATFVAHNLYGSAIWAVQHAGHIREPNLRGTFILYWSLAAAAGAVAIYLGYKFIMVLMAEGRPWPTRDRWVAIVILLVVSIVASDRILAGISNEYLWPVSTLAVVAAVVLLFSGIFRQPQPVIYASPPLASALTEPDD